MTINLDYDGTCVTHEFPAIGKDIGAEPVLKALVAAGHQLILWTMRSDYREDGSNPLREAVEWFKQRDIPLYGVNHNSTQGEWTSSPKSHAQLIIDDTALGAPLIDNGIDRPFIDWKAVTLWLMSRGIL